MSRRARTVFIDVPHHVTQRGNYQQPVFTCERHYSRYLEWLSEYSGKHSLELLGYCLMPNHVHLVVLPRQPLAIAQALAATHMRHAQMVNRERGNPGHLWQGRFHSCPLDDRHLMRALRYVELNPVRAELVQRPAEWRWSSARAHLLGEPDELLAEQPWPTEDRREWAGWLAEVAGDDAEAIRKRTHSGWPWGEESFVERLEVLAGRSLRPRRPGRPRSEP
ncbi:MAG: transposase [Armatimonadetes bacterium]|nr:transposase [Armatimonadota bacterium]